MKAMVELPDQLLREAERLAEKRRVSLELVVEESLRRYLGEEGRSEGSEPSLLPVLEGPSPVAGVDLDDTSRLWEL